VRRVARSSAAFAAALAGLWAVGTIGTRGPLSPSTALSHTQLTSAVTLHLVWKASIPVANPNVIALSAPTLATLTGGPAVVVGNRDKSVYAYHLATGGTVPGWPKSVGAPVTSTPSVVKLGSTAHDTVLVGTGNSGTPCTGGYQWIYPNGAEDLVRANNPKTDYACNYGPNGVRASIAIGKLQGAVGAVAGSMGQMTYALNASNRATLSGFPWFQGDSNFATPAIADVDGDGSNEIIEGGASTAGIAYGKQYINGGHFRILTASGGLKCELTTDEAIDSSPAVGRFLAGTAVGIVAGTGSTYPSASQHDQVIAVNTACHEVWGRTLSGTTATESPALADVLGNGRLQVIETTSTGGVWALTGANGGLVWHQQLTRAILGSPVTAELGTGHQDVVVATVNGFDILTGKSGAAIDRTVTASYGFQNAPLVTDDPNGTVGITVAGYQAGGSYVLHYEINTSKGGNVDAPGTWPQFHHDPQLTGNADAPLVPLAPFTGYTRVYGATADATAAAELEHQFTPGTDCPGTTSTRPVVLATDATYPDALASAPLARALRTGTLLTPTESVSAPTLTALRKEGITRVVVVGGHFAVSTTVVTTLQHTPVYPCGGGTTPVGTQTITVTRIWGPSAYDTAENIATTAVTIGGIGSLDLSVAYGVTNATGGKGRYNDTKGNGSPGPVGTGALTTAIVATGHGFQDAMAASTLAYASRLPILLTTPRSLSTQVTAFLSFHGVQQVIVMGGPGAVSDTVVTSIENLTPRVSVLRVAGLRFTDTATQLARLETSATPTGAGWHGTGNLTVARGDFYTDGLAGAVVAADGPTATQPSPLVLTQTPTDPGSALETFLYGAGRTGIGGTKVARFTVLGGQYALTQTAIEVMGADL